MSNFYTFLDFNNRIRYPMLANYIMARTAYEFLQEVKMPFLIGKELFEGDLFAQSLKLHNATFRFKASQLKSEELKPSNHSITRAIYLICKNKGAFGENVHDITLGRSSNNDITIADYAISKQHAVFTRQLGGKYFVEDLGSTNGVRGIDRS